VWSDGATYEGKWEFGKAVGFGKFTHPNGDFYMGRWNNDKANGWGIFQKTNEEDPKDSLRLTG